jgi:ATP-dependent helicase/nuclease subunit A
MREEFPEAGRRVLGRNYRSVPDVIHFVNALFADTFPGAEHALEPHRQPVSDRPAVEFVWSTDPDQPDPSAGERRRIEAQWLARLIAQRLRDGWPIWDARTRSTRNATAGDVVFLFRTLNDSAEYELALEGVGLDFYLSGGAAFYARQEVLDVINLLTIVEDPCDVLALAATLRGPFACVSDDGLYWLSRSLDGGLCAGFDAWERLPNLSVNDRRRIGRFAAFLGRLRGAKDRMPIARLLDRALDESGFEAAVLAEPMGRRKRANVRKLVERARQFDVQSGLTLADFVSRLRADLHDPPREAEAATTDEDSDAIQFMTIHASKGKEFPIVVLPDLNKDRANRALTAVFRPHLGLLVRFKDDSEGEAGQDLGMVLERHFETAEEEAEALRLLYVATTRAKDALILSAGGAATDKPRSPAMELLARRFDRADGTCLDSSAGPIPPIRVTTERPEMDVGPIPRKRRRPRYLAVANAIERASASGVVVASSVADRPSVFDFHAMPAASPFREARFRPFQAVLGRLDNTDLLGVASQVERAARTLGIIVSQAVRDDVARWVESILRTEPGTRLAAGASFRSNVSWSLAWPPDHARPTVFTGTADLLLHDGDRVTDLVVIDLDASAASSLRLALAERALVDSPGKVTLGRWIVRPGESLDVRKAPPMSGDAIETLIDRMLQNVQK